MATGVYVLAVLGESPAVLTELLWWLQAVERLPIAGIEAWATDRGANLLRDLVEGPEWSALEAQTGPLPHLQPTDDAPESSYGFRVHRFRDGDLALDDVRSERESAAVSADLHDRVRALRTDLPDRIHIVGSIAGGRKTVSAALQTAFCLQAGPSDRLVHVLLDARLENHLREQAQLQDYLCPTEAWESETGVPQQEQVHVYDVPFPRLRHLVPRRLAEVLDELPWRDVWPALDANMGRHAAGRLTRTGYQSWLYEVVDLDTGRVLFHQPLKRRAGALLAAMAEASPDATAADLVAWLDANEVGWAPPAGKGSDLESRSSTIRTAASDLRRTLEAIPVGLERFAPPEQGFAMPHVTAEWANF